MANTTDENWIDFGSSDRFQINSVFNVRDKKTEQIYIPDNYEASVNTSAAFGNVGEKIELTLTLEFYRSWGEV